MSIRFRDIGNSDYYLIVNTPELFSLAEEKGFRNVVLLEDNKLDEKDIQALKDSGKFVVAFIFCNGNFELVDSIKDQMQNEAIDCSVLDYHFAETTYGDNPDESPKTVFDIGNNFPNKFIFEKDILYRGLIKHSDETYICSNCGNQFAERDKYCERCGAKRGDGKFTFSANDVVVLYGAPTTYKLKCNNCGHSWEGYAVGSRRSEYCPQCGKKAVETLEAINRFKK